MNESDPGPSTDWIRVIRSEFAEMPGLRLTRPQAQRLWSLDPVTCEGLLEALVDARVLRRTPAGEYLRADT